MGRMPRRRARAVVLVLDPAIEFAVEDVDVGEVERAGEEAHADGTEETLDFALGGAVADGAWHSRQPMRRRSG